MNKIIAAFDGLHYSRSTKEYALYFANLMNAHLVGVFMDDIARQRFSPSSLVSSEGSIDENDHHTRQDDEQRNDVAASFETDCLHAGINYTIHRDRNIALHELIHES